MRDLQPYKYNVLAFKSAIIRISLEKQILKYFL